MELREDGGRVDDPPPEHECNAGCGKPVFRQYALCTPCYVMRDKQPAKFRALVKQRGRSR